MLYKNLVINGKEFKLAVNLTGKGAPTQKTEGQIGSIYMDESSDDKKLYKCTGNLGGSYTWVEFDKNADWGTLLSKPFDKINQAELEVVGMESDRQLGVKAIAKSKVTGLDEKLNEIDQSLLGKQPKGDYSTKTELTEGLNTKVNKTGRTPNKILGVDEGGNVVDVDAPSGIVAQEEAPTDTDVLWIDTNDETNPSRIVIDPTLKLEGQAADAKATGDALKKLENLVVYVTKTPLETYTADYNSTEIRNAAISNKKVELRYEDVDTNSGDQVYAFETFKDGEAIFRRNVITATEAYRINIFVDHVGNVRFEKTNLDLSKYALKSEIPAKLPNPYALTFTGAANETYDGTQPVSVNIPEGGTAPGGLSAEWEDILIKKYEASAEKPLAVIEEDTGNLNEYAELIFAWEGLYGDKPGGELSFNGFKVATNKNSAKFYLTAPLTAYWPSNAPLITSYSALEMAGDHYPSSAGKVNITGYNVRLDVGQVPINGKVKLTLNTPRTEKYVALYIRGRGVIKNV